LKFQKKRRPDLFQELLKSSGKEPYIPWLGIVRARCPNCGGILETREFVDCWNTQTGEPTDVNKDLYCPKCDLRWAPEEGPHNFKEDWNPEFHREGQQH